MPNKIKPQKKQNSALRYAANLIGMGAGVYIVSATLLRLLLTLFVRCFHQSATLSNPVSVPSAAIVLVNILMSFVPLLCATVFITKLYPQSIIPDINLKFPCDKRLWTFLPVFIAAGFLINAITTQLQNTLANNTQYAVASQASLPTGFFTTLGAIIYMCILPAVFEELLCRGIMQTIMRRWGVWFSIVVSSTLFTLLHADIAQMPGIFAFSVMLGLAYYATDSLSVCVILHFANNLVAFLFMSVQQKLSGAAMVGFAFYIMLIVFLCAAICVAYIVKEKLLSTLKPIPKVYDPKNRQSRTETLATSPFFMVIMLALAVRAFIPLFVRI